MYNYRETQLQEIIQNGTYWMANKKLAKEYVKELREMGHDFYVIHGLGESGVRDVIFNKESARKVYDILTFLKEKSEKQLKKLNEAIPFTKELCE